MPAISPFRPSAYLFGGDPEDDPFAGGNGDDGGGELTPPAFPPTRVDQRVLTKQGNVYVAVEEEKRDVKTGKYVATGNLVWLFERVATQAEYNRVYPTPAAPILRTVKGVVYEYDPKTKTLSPVGGLKETQTADTITYGRVEEADGSISSITYRKNPDGSLALDNNNEPVVVRKVETKGPDPAKLVWVDIGGYRVGLHPTTGEEKKRIARTLTPDQVADNERQAAALNLTREQFEYRKQKDAQDEVRRRSERLLAEAQQADIRAQKADIRAQKSWEVSRQVALDEIARRQTEAEQAQTKADILFKQPLAVALQGIEQRTSGMPFGAAAAYAEKLKAIMEGRPLPQAPRPAGSQMPLSQLPGGQMGVLGEAWRAGVPIPGTTSPFFDLTAGQASQLGISAPGGLGQFGTFRVGGGTPAYGKALAGGLRPGGVFSPPGWMIEQNTPTPSGFMTPEQAAAQRDAWGNPVWDVEALKMGKWERMPAQQGMAEFLASSAAEEKRRKAEEERIASIPFKVQAMRRRPFYQM